MSNAEVQRLLQAMSHFSARTRGAQLPKGVQEGVEALQQALGQPLPGHDSPGSREALAVAPGTKGTGAPMAKAALGPDGPSPGQKEAQGLSGQIAAAAAEIASHAQK